MASVNDLSTSISEMSSDELFEFIRNLRTKRRTSAETYRKTKSKKSGVPTSLNLDSLISSLSEDNRASLLKLLGE